MKKYIPHIIAFAVGALIASLVFLLIRTNERKIDENGVLVKTEATYKVDTISAGKDELAATTKPVSTKDTVKIYIKVPIYIPSDSTGVTKIDTVYQDRYVYLPRQHYHTKTSDVEIWHSGIESSIDSLVNYRRTTTITNTYRKAAKNEVSVYGGIGYSGPPVAAAGVRYMYRPKEWLGVGGKAERDFINDINSVMAVVEFTFKF